MIVSATCSPNRKQNEKDQETHPASPRAEVLQRIRDELHAIAEHRLDVELLVLLGDRRQEEDEAAAGFQHVT